MLAYAHTNSISILSSLADSALDFIASAISMLAVRQSVQPADETHRYGFGKAEALAALVQAFIINGSLIYVLYEAFNHIANPVPVNEPLIGIVSIVFSILLSLWLIHFQRKVIKKTKSLTIEADAAHYKGDLILNLGVICSLIASSLTHIHWIDSAVGVAAALYIGYSAYKIALASVKVLMDRELKPSYKKQIIALLLNHPEVKGYHELKSRSSGTRDFVQVHLEMDGDLSLNEAHKISEEIERAVIEKFPKVHLTIHQDPFGHAEQHIKL